MNSNEKKALIHYAIREFDSNQLKEITDAILEYEGIPYSILESLLNAPSYVYEDGIQIKTLAKRILIDQLKSDDDCDVNAYNAALVSENIDRCLNTMDCDNLRDDIYDSKIKLTIENRTFGHKEFDFSWSAQFYNAMSDAMETMMTDW